MSGERVHRASYEIDVTAPAGVVYGLIADTTQWPLIAPSSIHVERLDFDGVIDRFRMWFTANGSVRSALSHRTLDSARTRIEFLQELPAGSAGFAGSAAPAVSMAGTWTVEPCGAGRSRLRLEHEFTVAAGPPGDVAWLLLATDTNSRAELEQLKENAERWREIDGLLLGFEDSVRVHGPAELVYDFLYGVADWPGRVPHVARAEVREDVPGVQCLRMETRAEGGGPPQATESVRICFPHASRIVHKQTRTPPLIEAHTGEWSVLPDETGVTVISQHSVLLRAADVERVLGPAADLPRARAHVRATLGRESLSVLQLAKRHAESAIRSL
ncbi:aromatase/cyclase (plasmid) [Streptomyces sp. NBC_00536]|uniref:aromatase/cyclase n=1 Tax=Streptomyces sp. NBC_00536 TaxID=2975769 RepID=UPI002E817550|nr:aromatase/cyclase [Streptomyces sp. NBC_00536]WUC84157.1 aromatase/cyclase [Streptomyces sp. NBC_00536]